MVHFSPALAQGARRRAQGLTRTQKLRGSLGSEGDKDHRHHHHHHPDGSGRHQSVRACRGAPSKLRPRSVPSGAGRKTGIS